MQGTVDLESPADTTALFYIHCKELQTTLHRCTVLFVYAVLTFPQLWPLTSPVECFHVCSLLCDGHYQSEGCSPHPSPTHFTQTVIHLSKHFTRSIIELVRVSCLFYYLLLLFLLCFLTMYSEYINCIWVWQGYNAISAQLKEAFCHRGQAKTKMQGLVRLKAFQARSISDAKLEEKAPLVDLFQLTLRILLLV